MNKDLYTEMGTTFLGGKRLKVLLTLTIFLVSLNGFAIGVAVSNLDLDHYEITMLTSTRENYRYQSATLTISKKAKGVFKCPLASFSDAVEMLEYLKKLSKNKKAMMVSNNFVGSCTIKVP